MKLISKKTHCLSNQKILRLALVGILCINFVVAMVTVLESAIAFEFITIPFVNSVVSLDIARLILILVAGISLGWWLGTKQYGGVPLETKGAFLRFVKTYGLQFLMAVVFLLVFVVDQGTFINDGIDRIHTGIELFFAGFDFLLPDPLKYPLETITLPYVFVRYFLLEGTLLWTLFLTYFSYRARGSLSSDPSLTH